MEKRDALGRIDANWRRQQNDSAFLGKQAEHVADAIIHKDPSGMACGQLQTHAVWIHVLPLH